MHIDIDTIIYYGITNYHRDGFVGTYLVANYSKIVGVTLIWQAAIVACKHNNYKIGMALLKFETLTTS